MSVAVGRDWMPPPGNHPVAVGASLSKALRARKGVAAPKRSNHLPDRDFYSIRCPSSLSSLPPLSHPFCRQLPAQVCRCDQAGHSSACWISWQRVQPHQGGAARQPGILRPILKLTRVSGLIPPSAWPAHHLYGLRGSDKGRRLRFDI
jgi:hypothetical protein